MELVSIGEFARLTRLSAKALRFYDELGLLSPAWGTERERLPSDLGVRVTFLATPPITADSQPDSDFAVPLR